MPKPIAAPPAPLPAAPADVRPTGDLSESVAGEEDPGAALDQAPAQAPGPGQPAATPSPEGREAS